MQNACEVLLTISLRLETKARVISRRTQGKNSFKLLFIL